MYTKTNHDHVLINFDVENRHIEQLMGFALPQFPEDAGFYFIMLLNCDVTKGHPYKDYIEMRPMHVEFKALTIEVDDDFWYNLMQLAFQRKLIMLDGELRATDLPVGENPRFSDIWDCDTFYTDNVRKELMP